MFLEVALIYLRNVPHDFIKGGGRHSRHTNGVSNRNGSRHANETPLQKLGSALFVPELLFL